MSALRSRQHKSPTYAIGLFLDHLFPVGSPNALMVWPEPSRSSARGSALILRRDGGQNHFFKSTMDEPVNRAIEVSSLAIGREDVNVEVVANSSLI